MTGSYSAIAMPRSAGQAGPVGPPAAVLGDVHEPLTGLVGDLPQEHDQRAAAVVQLEHPELRLRRLCRDEPVTHNVE
jgi:hypothetical protein